MVNNTNYGSGALEKNSGINNTAVGAFAATNNLAAYNNTAVGSNTAFFNTTGNNNTSLGAGSLCNNQSGSLNTAVGSSALECLTGSVGDQNTAVGAQALYKITTGDLNTAIGTYAGINVESGSCNTFVGANTTATANNTSYSTALGFGATITGSNQIMMGGVNDSGVYPQVVVPGGITGTTGSFDYLGVKPNNNNSFIITDTSNILIQIYEGFGGSVCINNSNPPILTSQNIYSTIIGSGSCNNLTIGLSNTTLGHSALPNVTIGNNNNAIGYNSLNGIIAGNYNIGIGHNAGSGISGYDGYDSSFNSYIGAFTNQSGPDINYSTAIGFNALITDSNQIMMGGVNDSGVYPQVVVPGGITGTSGSFTDITTANSSFFQGVYVGLGNGGINTNVALGSGMPSNVTGDSNTALGGQTLQNNTTGSQNTSSGYFSLNSNTTGNYNSGFGESALRVGTTGSYNTGIGASSLVSQQLGSYNSGLGYNSGSGFISGGNNTFLGGLTSVSINPCNNSTAIGYNAQITSSNQIMIGGSNLSGVYPQVVVPGGITGPTGSFSFLRASQTISAPAGITGTVGNFSGTVTANNYQTSSDYRIKENITPLNDTYIVDPLVPVTYINLKTKKQDVGLVAHELEKVYPFLVEGDKDGSTFQSVNYNGLIGILIKEIKDLKERVKKLEHSTSH